MQGLLLNLRLAMRQLRHTPGFTLTVVLTLALGIGATTAIFSLMEGILLRPLPFHDPARLVTLNDTIKGEHSSGIHSVMSHEIEQYTRDTRSFSSLGGFGTLGYELSGRGEPTQVNGGRMTAGVFPTLGVAPMMGRVFTQQEDEGRQPVAVLSYGTWKSRFHNDPNVIGTKILLDRKPYVVIGVMPSSFEFPVVPGRLNRVDLWVPASFTAEELAASKNGNFGYQMVGRLKPGVTMEQARQDAEQVAQQEMRGFPPMLKQLRIHAEVLSLKEGGRTGTGGASHGRLRSALVVTEIAVALILLTAAGALLRSFEKMRDVDPGFRADHVLVAGYSLPAKQYPTQTAIDTFDRSLVERLEALPGISAAGMTNVLPASGILNGSAFIVDGAKESDSGNLRIAPWIMTCGDYFRSMGIPLIHGRYLNASDKEDAPLAVVVNQSLARHFWPGSDAIGKRLHIGVRAAAIPWATVVGVVADTKIGSPDTPSQEQIYAPDQQFKAMLASYGPPDMVNGDSGYIVLRSSLPPEQMTNALRSTVASLDPLLALQQIQTMSQQLSTSEAPRRFNTSVVTVFAAGALLLATIGVYAVIAFSVSMRAQEMAIRMALGSRRGEIVRLVLNSGAKLALLGCGVGLVGSLAVARLLGSMLFNVSATDPLILMASMATMLVLALMACAIPAQRAASANPVDALRSE